MKSRFTFPLLATLMLVLTAGTYKASAQTCSVNAGVSSSVCISGTMTLTGNATGAMSVTAKWALVSGPNVPTITSPSSATTTVTGFIAGDYIFRYYATCSDASVASDSVNVHVDAIPSGFTAGNDTFVCGQTAILNATLPAGASGTWSYFNAPAPNGLGSMSFGTPSSKNSSFVMGAYSNTCPKISNVVWTVTQGTCSAKDTATISFGGQASYMIPRPDVTVCGTSYNLPTGYYYGCGGSVVTTQLAGPGTATVSTVSGGFGQPSFSNLITGTYTFAITVTPCTGSIYRDTFNLTIGSTVAVTNPNVPGKDICPEQFDSVYYYAPTVALLPGETMTWNLNPTGKLTPPATVTNPTADTIGNILRLRNVVHPDTNANYPYWYYTYSYTVSNGTCSQTYSVTTYLTSPLNNRVFNTVVNLPCGATAGTSSVVPPGSPSINGLNFSNVVVVSKPAGAAAPAIATSSGNITASSLVPGKYVFKFDYFRNYTRCGVKSASVEVNVSALTGLSNGGTDQILPCGVDSSTLAGNVPPAGQLGTWQLVSGPSTVILTNPNSASLLIKNLLPGAYRFRWSISNGSTCTATSDDMSVVVTPSAPLANAGPDRTACFGYRTALNGNSTSLGTTGRWRQIGGSAVSIADSTAAVTSFTGSVASSVYTFTWTLSNPCGTGKDTVVITTGASQGPSDAVITTADTCMISTATSLTLNAIAPVTGSGSWSQLSGPVTATIATPAAASTTVSGMSAGGEYKFIWRVTSAGCDTLRDTVSIARRTSALSANAGTDRYICGDTLNLAATNPSLGIGTWTQIGGPGSTIASIHSPGSNVSGLAGGSTYDYVWTVNLGVCPASRDTMHVGVSVPPSAAVIATRDTLICGITLTANSSRSQALSALTPAVGTGSWLFLQSPYNGGSIADASAANTTASLYAGVSQLVWQVTSGACPATKDTLNIEIVPLADAGPATYNLCAAISQSLQGTQPGNGTVLWSQVSGPSMATITQPAKPITSINNMIAGVYKFRYNVTHPVTGCSSSDSVTITNSAQPKANAGRDTAFCYNPSGATVLYLKADTPAVGTGVWSRTLGSGSLSYAPNASANPTNASVNTPGLHQFKWTVTNGSCTAIDYKDVSVEQLTVPAINFSPTTACKDSFSVSIASPYNNFNYAWSFQRARIRDTAGLNLTGPITNNFLVSDTNNIYLTISNPVTGCKAKDSTSIIVNCSYLPLPLRLLSFTARKNNSSVMLNWVTAAEKDIRSFHIERSADGSAWSSLGTVNAKGQGGLQSNYSYTDQQPLPGINLYRLHIEESDGSYTYSPVRMVQMDGAAGDLLIYPNPASEQVQIVLAGNSISNSYMLTDALGKILMQGSLQANTNNKIDLNLIPAGIYILKVLTDDVSTVRQIQIQK